ncbi:hypothetical protein [Nostoc sp.]
MDTASSSYGLILAVLWLAIATLPKYLRVTLWSISNLFTTPMK